LSIQLVVFNPTTKLLDVVGTPLASAAQIVTADINGVINPPFVLSASTNFTITPFSATPVFDAGGAGVLKIVLTGNVTSSSIINPTAGQTIRIIVTQDVTGGRTFVWPTNVLGATDLSTTATTSSIMEFVFDGTNWLAVGYTGLPSIISNSAIGQMNIATFGATTTFNAALATQLFATTFRVVLTGNTTVAITNPTQGQTIVLILVQDGTGGWVVTWPSYVKGAPDMSTTAGTSTVIELTYDGTNWLVSGLTGI
jgi:hypothetical protein